MKKNQARILAFFIAASIALAGCQVGLNEVESEFYKKKPIQNIDSDKIEAWI